MKRYLSILILSIFFGILPAKADFIATQDFYVDADTTITIVVSGDLTTSINGNSGHLGTPLNINFNISSNEAANDIRMRAMITDASAVQHSAFYCTNTSAVTSQSMFLIMAEKDIEAPSILNCKNGASTVENNPCAIAYPGTVSITNNGSTVQYVENGGDGYFSANVIAGTTDLNMTLATSTKAGTYDVAVSNDCAENYEVTVYLDNIPGS